ncbi:MAG: hypothetical protein HC824_14165 [Synechococcales cyanobacterium RM1_1_8]|nr:hypothetical protein [Synechococcales cyanobacterium RM1_1_8]
MVWGVGSGALGLGARSRGWLFYPTPLLAGELAIRAVGAVGQGPGAIAHP